MADCCACASQALAQTPTGNPVRCMMIPVASSLRRRWGHSTACQCRSIGRRRSSFPLLMLIVTGAMRCMTAIHMACTGLQPLANSRTGSLPSKALRARWCSPRGLPQSWWRRWLMSGPGSAFYFPTRHTILSVPSPTGFWLASASTSASTIQCWGARSRRS